MRYLPFLLVIVSALGCHKTTVLTAIEKGDYTLAEKLISEGASLATKDSDGDSALHVAIRQQARGVYSMLLEHGADPNACNRQGSAAMHLASEQEDVFWIHEAIQHGGDVNQLNIGNRHRPNSTPIFYALYARSQSAVRELIKAGADLNHVNDSQSTPLSVAFGTGSYGLMIEMIDAGADPRVGTFCLDGRRYSDGRESEFRHLTSKREFLKLKALLIERGFLKKGTKEGEWTRSD